MRKIQIVRDSGTSISHRKLIIHLQEIHGGDIGSDTTHYIYQVKY